MPNLFSSQKTQLEEQAKDVLKAYDTAYAGDPKKVDDPQMELARQELRTYFASIEQGYGAT